jgi:hypothetical protein
MLEAFYLFPKNQFPLKLYTIFLLLNDEKNFSYLISNSRMHLVDKRGICRRAVTTIIVFD